MTTPADEIRNAIRAGAHAAFGKTKDQRAADDSADELISLDADGESSRVASSMLFEAVDALYENGWQPADIMHVVRRGQQPAVMRLAAVLLLHRSRQIEVHVQVPDEWADQIGSIAEQFPTAPDILQSLEVSAESFLRALRVGAGKTDYMSANDQWLEVLVLIGQLSSLPAWPRLGPSPSQWHSLGARLPRPRLQSPGDRAPSNGSSDSKALGRIRGLLAKAEGTEYDEEAQTLMAKAQELMTRYSIDSALLEGTNFDVLGKRLHIDNPHPAAKAHLLHEVGLANRVKVIWDNGYGVATVVGAPIDVGQVELLFTALLVQANRSLSEAVAGKRHKKTSSSAFGKAFFYAFAVRIGARLAEAEQDASREASREAHTDVLPVLAAQSVAVQNEFDRLFPSAKAGRRPTLDALGWETGHSAADQAILH